MQTIKFESEDYGPFVLHGPDASGRYTGSFAGDGPHDRLRVSVKPPTKRGGAWAVSANRDDPLNVRSKAEVADLLHNLLNRRD